MEDVVQYWEPTPIKFLYCSFCGKNQTEVYKLIIGPDVKICSECVCKCVEVLAST